ncbi:MAG: hypothetical protein ACI9ES_002351 [Oceanospirillaceae bacterium]|jgi:hypothetical protein
MTLITDTSISAFKVRLHYCLIIVLLLAGLLVVEHDSAVDQHVHHQHECSLYSACADPLSSDVITVVVFLPMLLLLAAFSVNELFFWQVYAFRARGPPLHSF